MNISKTLLEEFDKLGIYYMFCDYDSLDEVPVEEANCINIGSKDPETCEVHIPIGTFIKTPKKKEVTLEWILNKINKESDFKNLSEYMKKILGSRESIDVYPTSYGIGMFRLFGVDKKTVELVEKTLKENNISYTNEYSDARWVYRFKISKKQDNIERLKRMCND